MRKEIGNCLEMRLRLFVALRAGVPDSSETPACFSTVEQLP